MHLEAVFNIGPLDMLDRNRGGRRLLLSAALRLSVGRAQCASGEHARQGADTRLKHGLFQYSDPHDRPRLEAWQADKSAAATCYIHGHGRRICTALPVTDGVVESV